MISICRLLYCKWKERRVSPSTLPSLGLLAFPLQPPLTAGCPRYAELDQSPRAAISRGAVGGVCQGSTGAEGTSLPSAAPGRNAGKFSLKSYKLCCFAPEPSAERVDMAFSGFQWPTSQKARGQFRERMRVRYSPPRVSYSPPSAPVAAQSAPLQGLAVLRGTLRYSSPCSVSSFVVISTSGKKRVIRRDQ